jgi:Phosphodiester glycosidase
MPHPFRLLLALFLPIRTVFALAPATVDRLSPGVEMAHYRFSDVPGVTQSVHVVRIAAADMPRLRFACTDRCETVGHWENQKFDVFVNGTFFNTYNTRGEPSCYVRLEGKERFATHPDEWRIHGGLVRAERDWSILPKPKEGWPQLKEVPDILTAGPVVLQDGKPYVPTRNALDTQRHARTLVGLDDKGNGYLVTVNGHVRRLGIRLHARAEPRRRRLHLPLRPRPRRERPGHDRRLHRPRLPRLQRGGNCAGMMHNTRWLMVNG